MAKHHLFHDLSKLKVAHWNSLQTIRICDRQCPIDWLVHSDWCANLWNDEVWSSRC